MKNKDTHLIATFMGHKEYKPTNMYYIEDTNIYGDSRSEDVMYGGKLPPELMYYKTNWGWIMAVVDKIKSTDLSAYFEEAEDGKIVIKHIDYVDFVISSKHVSVYLVAEGKDRSMVYSTPIKDNPLIDVVNEACVSFIEHYNGIKEVEREIWDGIGKMWHGIGIDMGRSDFRIKNR